MPFYICCDNKGCYETTEALLNTKTNEVHCRKCGEIIKNITYFTKVQLKSMGQVMKNTGEKAAFAAVCYKCGKKNTPKLSKQARLLCAECGEDITDKIPGPIAQAIKLSLTGQI